MRLKINIKLLIALSLIFFCGHATAHNLWLNPDTHYPGVGETINIGIGWGHDYPEERTDETVEEDLLREIKAMGPDKREAPLEKESAELYRLQIDKPGAYIISAAIRVDPGMFTTTPKGRKRGSKKDVENPIKCMAYDIFAKTLVVAGGDKSNLDGQAGHPLEVVPLEDPSTLLKGDTLRLKVLYRGESVSGIALRAKYAGYGGHDRASYAVTAETDDQGEAALEMKREGFWIILLSHTTPYPDADVCDEYIYHSAFTFEIGHQENNTGNNR